MPPAWILVDREEVITRSRYFDFPPILQTQLRRCVHQVAEQGL